MIPFVRIQSCGNDFLLIANWDNRAAGNEAELARAVCRRGLSEGADGILLAERPHGQTDIRMRLINPDGTEAEMCGNGALAFSRAVVERLGLGPKLTVETLGGTFSATVDRDRVTVMLRSLPRTIDRRAVTTDGEETDVRYLEIYRVPHAVVRVHAGDQTSDVARRLGSRLCHHATFPRGANVDFASLLSRDRMEVRTFERGVDAETLSCGTGSIASFLALRLESEMADIVEVQTPGGSLRLRAHGSDASPDVEIEGNPFLIAEGALLEDAWRS